ncbi:hypothetical protein BOTBODRAFT_112254, partial [Botryobasidium botryosum FD-172 SS1]
PRAGPPEIYLYVCIEDQALGEPTHRSLVIAREGSEPAEVYQVKGDPLLMAYTTTRENVFASESFNRAVALRKVDGGQATVVRRIASDHGERPTLRAETQREATRNCQNWTTEVVHRLVEGDRQARAVRVGFRSYW